MFGRQIDVVLVKPNKEAIILVDHTKHPNTFVCSGSFDRYCSTECDKLQLSIYNLPALIRGEIALSTGCTIIVRYGYKDEGNNLGDLFIGNIIRSSYQKPDEVTGETKIWVYDTGEFKMTSFFSGAYVNGVNFYQIAKEIAKQGKEEGNIDAIKLSEKLKDFAVYNSKTLFGSSDDCLQEIADDTNMVYKKSNNSLSILTPEEIIQQEDIIVFSVFDETTGKVESRSGMIGIPQLTNSGIQLNCLINTNLNIYSLIKINNSIVSNAQEGAIPNAEYGATLDPDGIYVVTSISGNFSNDGQKNSMKITAVAKSVFTDMYEEKDNG